jgi:hypothetical protein
MPLMLEDESVNVKEFEENPQLKCHTNSEAKS